MPAATTQLSGIADRTEIARGVMMPRLGLGTSRAGGRELERAMAAAFAIGYRLIDTSANYGNETEVGRAIAASDVPREELFVTTKLEGSDQGARRPHGAIEQSLRRLGLEYVDLYLIHWPEPTLTNETWSAMEGLLEAGVTRAIGVSNFEPSDLEQLFSTANVPPAVNQIKLNPAEPRHALYELCVRSGITVEAWAPIMRGAADEYGLLARIARVHGRTPTQISLRWLLQKDIVAIPKTVHDARLRENADVFDFALSSEEMREIDEMGSRR